MQRSELNLKVAGEYERSGQFDKALTVLMHARKISEGLTFSRVINGNISRILIKAERKAIELMSSLVPVPIHEHRNNPYSYWDNLNINHSNLPPIISLTSISSRIERVEKTIKSILQQTISPQSINLYISDEPYLIDKGILEGNDNLKLIANLGVNIYKVPNIGPYRKQIPLISQLRSISAPPKTPFITIDDDVLYPTDILEKLITPTNEDDVVVSHRGREIIFDADQIAPYETFIAPIKNRSYLNIGTGKNGIAYRLGYFPTKLGDFIGPVLAPTADDIWCKWVTAAYCVPTLILEPAAAYDPTLDFRESEPADKNGLFHKYNAKGSNDDSLNNLEEYFSKTNIGMASLLGNIVNV